MGLDYKHIRHSSQLFIVSCNRSQYILKVHLIALIMHAKVHNLPVCFVYALLDAYVLICLNLEYCRFADIANGFVWSTINDTFMYCEPIH